MRFSPEEEDDFVARMAASSQLEPQSKGIPALDELAEILEVEPGGGNGIMVMGMSGKTYSLVAIISKHLLVIADDLLVRRKSEQ